MSAFAQPLAYTDAEVGCLLRVSRRTVYRLRKSGALPTVRIGRSVRIPAAALTRFLERAEVRRDLFTSSDAPKFQGSKSDAA